MPLDFKRLNTSLCLLLVSNYTHLPFHRPVEDRCYFVFTQFPCVLLSCTCITFSSTTATADCKLHRPLLLFVFFYLSTWKKKICSSNQPRCIPNTDGAFRSLNSSSISPKSTLATTDRPAPATSRCGQKSTLWFATLSTSFYWSGITCELCRKQANLPKTTLKRTVIKATYPNSTYVIWPCIFQCLSLICTLRSCMNNRLHEFTFGGDIR